jgi:hypothetical protein
MVVAKDTCFGDSGGSLVTDLGASQFLLVGVVSSSTVPASQVLFFFFVVFFF